MDEERTPVDETLAGPPGDEPSDSRRPPAPGAPPVVPLEMPERDWSAGSAAGCRRPALVGGVTLLIVLVLLLVAALQLTRRTMWLTMDRAAERLRQEALEAPLEPHERQRLLSALARMRERLPMSDDPYPLIGAFLGRVQSDLEDGRLTRDEVLATTELLSELAVGRVPE